MHDLDVLDELGQELLHPFGCGCESVDLLAHSTELILSDTPMNLEELLVSLQSGLWVECLRLKPLQLLVNVLLWEHKHIELIRLYQVRTLGHLLYELREQVTSFLEELLCCVAKRLFLRQCWNIQAWQSLHKTVSEGKEVLVSAFYLESLLGQRVHAIDDVDEMVVILVVVDNLEVS